MTNSRKKFFKKFLLVAVVTMLLAALTTTTVFASRIYAHGTDTDGWSRFTSCGSSAGNSSWSCPPGGGPCVDVTDYRTDQFCNLPPSQQELAPEAPPQQ